MSRTSTFWIGLGANLGDPPRAMAEMLDGLAAAGDRIEAASSLYRTAPRDLEDQPPFINAAARLSTEAEPSGLLARVKELEAAIGRRPGVRFGPRVIDCDLLLWSGGAWSDATLEIPHPRLTDRRFALVPLLEIDPGLILPDGRRLAECERVLASADQPVNLHLSGDDWAALDWRGSRPGVGDVEDR